MASLPNGAPVYHIWLCSLTLVLHTTRHCLSNWLSSSSSLPMFLAGKNQHAAACIASAAQNWRIMKEKDLFVDFRSVSDCQENEKWEPCWNLLWSSWRIVLVGLWIHIYHSEGWRPCWTVDLSALTIVKDGDIGSALTTVKSEDLVGQWMDLHWPLWNMKTLLDSGSALAIVKGEDCVDKWFCTDHCEAWRPCWTVSLYWPLWRVKTLIVEKMDLHWPCQGWRLCWTLNLHWPHLGWGLWEMSVLWSFSQQCKPDYVDHPISAESQICVYEETVYELHELASTSCSHQFT